MTTFIVLLALLGTVLVLGGAGWWSYNWWMDWQTRLKRRLPAPPFGTVWQLKADYEEGGRHYNLCAFDVITEQSKQICTRWVSNWQKIPNGFDMSAFVANARREVLTHRSLPGADSQFL